MPRYCFECPICHGRKEVTRSMKDSNLSEICSCGVPMDRDYVAEHSAVRGDYNDPIESISMAFNTQDLAEHRRRHPGIELKVDMPGHTAYPIFRSLSQKRAYLKARKWQDCNSFV